MGSLSHMDREKPTHDVSRIKSEGAFGVSDI
jgi:hypothetical protein